ncbi:MAG: PhzF family phenazine biosynthesis isomerase [Terrimonas sp.]|nr:PhzF family phenazine biosynthesis isomerase [Terrimonas sp.]
MNLTIYQVDAFTNQIFEGNPAAVIPLTSWADDALLQNIALENNLSETAYFVPTSDHFADFELRWFTPELEIDLCGHATLAAAFVIFNYLDFEKTEVSFATKSGKLVVEKRADVYVMDFPSWKPERIATYPDGLEKILGIREIVGVYKHRDLVVELNHANDVMNAQPDFTAMKAIPEKIIITAPGTDDIDFVSRFFAPTAGIDEDPVTGSAHVQLIPFWAEKLNKKKMHAKQLSGRGGELWCGLWGDRVTIAGQCAFYMKGEISV